MWICTERRSPNPVLGWLVFSEREHEKTNMQSVEAQHRQKVPSAGRCARRQTFKMYKGTSKNCSTSKKLH